ncbi:MAG TPA: DUF4912 domain-containing protein [Haliangiales bacterium]|nr:DUF4912 domain-containing protein [Haliangiales bacterium]
MKPEKKTISVNRTASNAGEAAAKTARPRVRRVTRAAAEKSDEPMAELKSETKSEDKPPKSIAASATSQRPLKVPPILLEGDEPSALPVSGPGQRYALGPTPPPEHAGTTGESGDLPEAYGTKKLLLAARDPHWLYAHWDFTRAQLTEYNRRSADGHLVLRVYLETVADEPFAEVHVHPESRNWFVHVGRGGTRFVAELGYYAKADGRWARISVSPQTLTPPDVVSSDTTVHFASIPIEVPFEQLLAVVKTAINENVPLAEAILQLRAQGFKGLPGPQEIKAGSWTPDQERALAELVAMDKVRRVWIGSLEITELIRRRLFQEISSAAVPQFSLPGEERAVGGVASVSSPFGAMERQKGFWFNINAELIVYGATESGAQVTIGGRVVNLRPDGSFSFRFALPDGQHELPVVAVSADQTDARAAELKFSRHTEYRGEVGAHPQDPRLKPPRSESVA